VVTGTDLLWMEDSCIDNKNKALHVINIAGDEGWNESVVRIIFNYVVPSSSLLRHVDRHDTTYLNIETKSKNYII
jgi:hypothetical protein